MDPHHHHFQNQQWRPRIPLPPIQQVNICPTCSYSHEPFCPPPHPSFNQNPIVPIFSNTSNEGFGHPRPYWDRNPSFNRVPYEQFPPVPPPPPPSYEFEGDRSLKRPRVSDFGNSGPPSVSSEDERRLKLIREHGSVPNEDRKMPFLHREETDAVSGQQNKPNISNGFRLNSNHGSFDGHPDSFLGQSENEYVRSVPSNEPNRSHINHWRGVFSDNHDPNNQHYPNGRGCYFPPSQNVGQMQGSGLRNGQPPIPASSPPPFHWDPPLPLRSSSELRAYPSLQSMNSGSSFHVPVSSCSPIPEAQPYFNAKPFLHTSTAESKQYNRRDQAFSLKQSSLDKPKLIDVSHLLRSPHRTIRPDHFVIILRGLPGSGKSYLAKMLRDIEVENGGGVPRIHSMDDYYMIEVEKVEEGDVSRSSSSSRGKKPVTKRVIEYCYEPEMEEAYRASMLKAFRKTLDEGAFTFIIVDDRNLRVADFAQFWANAKSSGYEVYILEASYKDPVGCAVRNVHGVTKDEIQKMAEQWEETPSFYLQLDVKSLFNGDDLRKSGIQEVDMDMEDEDDNKCLSGLVERIPDEIRTPPAGDTAPDEDEKDAEGYANEVKLLGRSKWSNEIDEDVTEETGTTKGKANALSGLIQAYGKEGKSVSWGDQGTGFSIGAVGKANARSLVIGPGPGYNLKSNPLPESSSKSSESNGQPKTQSRFQEQLQAERELFKAVFKRRQQRIGLDLEEE